MNWKVKYTDIETMLARRPFFKHTVVVSANSRKEAIEKVMNYHGNNPKYSRFSASRTEEKACCLIC